MDHRKEINELAATLLYNDESLVQVDWLFLDQLLNHAITGAITATTESLPIPENYRLYTESIVCMTPDVALKKWEKNEPIKLYLFLYKVVAGGGGGEKDEEEDEENVQTICYEYDGESKQLEWEIVNPNTMFKSSCVIA